MRPNGTLLIWVLIAANVWLIGSAARAQTWAFYGGDAGGTRHIAAAQIDKSNVSNLEIAWTFHTGDLVRRPEAVKFSAFEGTPILAEGQLVFCTPFDEVIALDPGTGTIRWRFDAKIRTDYRPGNDFVCRGVAFWRDEKAPPNAPCASRIFLGTVDARLIAIDARRGKLCTGFGGDGEVRIDPGENLLWPGEFQITSPPVLAGDRVIVGSSISDSWRKNEPAGAVRAFDARTGASAWTFDPIGGARGQTGAGNVWAPMSVDEKRGLVFLPTSSPSPDYFGGTRPGNNGYADSVVALRAQSGAVVWSYQTIHHDIWDYDLPAQPTLATVTHDGRRIDVVVQVTKTGFVFVLDRDTGRPVFPVDERPAPQNGVTGEVLSRTQPVPRLPPPLVPQHLTPDMAWGLTFWDRGRCRDAIARHRSDGLFTPPSTEGTIFYPSDLGGANWGGAAFDPRTGTLFVNTTRIAQLVTLIPQKDYAREKKEHPEADIRPQAGTPWAVRRDILLSPFGMPCAPPPWGTLTAVDIGRGSIKWRSTLGTIRDMAPVPIPWKLGTPNIGGPMFTDGGLVFIAAAMDNYLRAFDAATGAELWKGRLPAGGQATPMSYVWRGRQYLVIAAGGHARAKTSPGDAIVAFALPAR